MAICCFINCLTNMPLAMIIPSAPYYGVSPSAYHPEPLSVPAFFPFLPERSTHLP